jgi:outer membrane lipoprotein SlyB
MLNVSIRCVLFAAVTVCAWGCAIESNVRPEPVSSTISYGRITAVKTVSVDDQSAQMGGALVGGTLGLIAGSGAWRGLTTVGGAFAGQQLARAASRRQAFQYTILLDGTSTITMVSDEAGLRIGDCVTVERGAFNNLRLADDAQCAPGVKPTATTTREAGACVAAKQALLNAQTEEAFDLAERKVRLLCDDAPQEHT